MEIRPDATPIDPASFSMSSFSSRQWSAEDEATAALVQRAATGDRKAFEQILIQHERRVVGLAWKLLGNAADAEDAAQEAFLRTYKYLHRFDPRRPLTPWLLRLTVNAAHDIARKRQRVQDLDSATTLTLESPDGNPYSSLASNEQKQMLQNALQQLSEKERAAIVLRDIEGFSTREVAHVLGSSQATVRSQISTARLKLKHIFQKRNGDRP